MKRLFLFLTFVLCAVVMLSAQGLYLEVGGGWGVSSTDYKPKDYGSLVFTDSDKVNYLGGKIGYRPIKTLPLYLVGEVSWTQGATYEDKEFIQYGDSVSIDNYELRVNHMFFAPGVVYYPTSFLQVAGSFGLINSELEYIETTDVFRSSLKLSDSNLGYGFNLSAAYDLGNKHGLLIGGKMSYFSNRATLETEIFEDLDSYTIKIDNTTFYTGLFIKYRFRG